jgi:hypothetical protein
MAIAFGAAGTFSGGTTSLSLAFPAGIASGHLLVMLVGNKYEGQAPVTPAGWSFQGTVFGGHGPNGPGSDVGMTRATAFTKVADGTESGTQAVSIPSGNSSAGRILRYTKDIPGREWRVGSASAPQNDANSLTWIATMTNNPPILADDLVIAFSVDNSDGFTWASQSLAATGCTFGAMVERTDNGSTQGDDLRCISTDHPCTAGPSTAPPVYTATLSGTPNVDRPSGCTLLLFLRESVIGPASALGQNEQFGLALHL